MGKSTTSCLKIISCGSHSVDEEDDYDRLNAPEAENKSSSDKRGWSFRKRPARHRILSNTVISEKPSSTNKESEESANKEFAESIDRNLQPPDSTVISEKAAISSTSLEKISESETQFSDEKLVLPTSVNSEVSKAAVDLKNENEVDKQLEESAAIVIQTAARGLLAEKELLKLKNLVKLQAAIRGHVVRRHAVGTLRCVQAIVKIQILVRARRARMLADKHDKEKAVSVNKPTSSYISIEKLLGNGFARQLLDSTPKNRPIHIKYDAAKPNSAWSWLERWMSVSSVEPTPKLQQEPLDEHLERKKDENVISEVESRTPYDELSELDDSKFNVKEAVLPSKSKENPVAFGADSFSTSDQPTYVEGSMEQPPSEKKIISDAKETSIDGVSKACQIEDEGEQPDQSKHSMKRSAPEQLEAEGKKSVFGSRKASSPSFIAAQSKFEELTATANSNRSCGSISQDSGIASNADTVQPAVDDLSRKSELSTAENSISYNSRAPYVGSECVTELSVTSTLDSPDVSDIGVSEYEHSKKVLEEETCNGSSMIEVDVKANYTSANEASNTVQPVEDEPEKVGDINESVDTNISPETQEVEMKPERIVSDLQVGIESKMGDPACRSSPEASPKSHMTVPESVGTPASNVSVNAKRSATEKSSSSQKRKSMLVGKSSAVIAKSGLRSSVEQLPQEQKNGKRRNSFGSTRPDPPEQEPRDSSSSNISLPHFMQATESARAKINANSSPRSSPDIQDREYVKKRHSLPGASGRQGSPRIHRSLAQAQQGAKGNGSHVVHEKQWQR